MRRQGITLQNSWIFYIVVVEVQDINPEEIKSLSVHCLQIAVVICVCKRLLTHNTVHWFELWEVVRVGLSLTIQVRLLVPPGNIIQIKLFTYLVFELQLTQSVESTHTSFDQKRKLLDHSSWLSSYCRLLAIKSKCHG